MVRDFASWSIDIFYFRVPRLFGLLSSAYDGQCLTPSWRWLILSNLIGHAFICTYPFAVAQIIGHRVNRYADDGSSMNRNIEIAQHTIMYLLSVAVFVRQMYFAQHQVDFGNRGLEFLRRCKALCTNRVYVADCVNQLIVRAVCSYIGYAFLNSFTIFYLYGDMAEVNFFFKIVFLIPNVAITTTTIRFHAAVMMLTITGRQINRAFRNCFENVNRTATGNRTKQERECCLAADRFDHIMKINTQCHDIASELERTLSILILFTIINNFISTTTSVCNGFCPNPTRPPMKFNFHSLVFKLIFLYVHLTSNDSIEFGYIACALIRSGLCFMDLAFTFIPSNQMKQEVRLSLLLILIEKFIKISFIRYDSFRISPWSFTMHLW